MNAPLERRGAPSLIGSQRREDAARAGHTPSLLDLMHEGFYLLFLLRNGAKPPHQARDDAQRQERPSDLPPAERQAAPPDAALMDETIFKEKIKAFLAEFDREARTLRACPEDIDSAKYAFCSALDEIVLNSALALRMNWSQRPMQLVIFGDQLAGDHFYDRLEELRSKGSVRLPALEVFHVCLLLGFKGKYLHDASDKLGYITARLGDEIANIKGKSRGFAPQAERPDQIVNKLRSELPLWALSALFAVVALGSYLGLRTSLQHATRNSMAAYADLVKLAPQPANITVTLP
jgi:type VI secretion system protein ImpK